ncbi:transposase [Acidovorax sp. Root70]|uniref:transposase n=1 Tax=unclassified Acidovorax TaxID=2684926 RepID=UPI003518D772
MEGKKNKCSEGQIIWSLRQAESGMAIRERCSNGGFRNATFYKWWSKFGGMQISKAQGLHGLEPRL